MRMLDNATQQALLKQAKLLSGPLMSPALERRLSIQPGRRRGGDAAQRLKPLVSPSLSLQASERSRQLKPQSSIGSRDGRHVYDDRRRRREKDDRLLARVASNRSSRTAIPRLYPSTPEQRLGSYRSSRVAEPWRGEASGGASRVGRSDRHSRLRRGSGRGDRSPSSSQERSSSRRRSVSRAPSTALGLGTGRSSTHRRVGRTDPRRGSERAAATPRWSSPSSSSDGEAAVTIRSRIRPNWELLDRCVRRAEEIQELSLRRRRKNAADSVRSGMDRSSRRPRRALDPIDSGSTYSSSSSASASVPSPSSTIPTAPSSPGASASPCSSSSVSVSPRARAPPEYAFEEKASSTSRDRRRRERQERREGRLRRFKNKLSLVFHHRHDHHHHHHIGRSGSPVSRKDRRGKSKTGKSPWSYLGGTFQHRSAGHDGGNKKKKQKKKSTSKTVATGKQRGGGGGQAHSLLDALVRHKWGGRRPPARAATVRTRSLSRVQVNKINWWQQLRRRRGRAEGSDRPRRRLKAP